MNRHERRATIKRSSSPLAQTDALSNEAGYLLQLGDLQAALAKCERAIALRPRVAAAHSNKGCVLLRLKRFADALPCFERAILLSPDSADIRSNLAECLVEIGRFDEAIENLEITKRLAPSRAEELTFKVTCCRLLTGDFEQGWRDMEGRPNRRVVEGPQWRGDEPLAGKTIFLHAEQGFGDVIQMCRYVPMVAALSARVILGVPEELHGLLVQLPGVSLLFSHTDALPEFDFHCPLMSLPLAFKTIVDTIPTGIPYLRGHLAARAGYSIAKLFIRTPRVGVVWHGNHMHSNDRNRSIPLKDLASLFGAKAKFLSLHQTYRYSDQEELDRLQKQGKLLVRNVLYDFEATANVIEGLDLVITVDTSVAHLAGAMGKPVWILLPYIPDWRWMLDREDSPWYPTARLFRQIESREWSSVIERVRDALAAWR